MDEHGYPTDDELETITKWKMSSLANYHALMLYIGELWRWNNYFTRNGNTYELSTGGGAGNEEIIGAMGNNSMFWLLYWKSSRRGGHYVFAPIGTELEASDGA